MATEEYYTMPFFITLTVNNIEASTDWYEKKLGFKMVFKMPGPDGKILLSHLRWVKYADILLVSAPPDEQSPHVKGAGVMMNFLVHEGSVDELAEKLSKNEVTIVNGPVTQPWNAREVSVLDLDGYLLTFTQQADSGITFDEIVQNIQKPE